MPIRVVDGGVAVGRIRYWIYSINSPSIIEYYLEIMNILLSHNLLNKAYPVNLYLN